MSYRIFIAAVMLMAGALYLNTVFSLLTFDGIYRDALLDRYYLPAKHLQSNLQAAATYGIKLDQAVGIERDVMRTQRTLLEEVATRDVRLAGDGKIAATLLIVSPQGEVLHRAGGQSADDTLPDTLAAALATPNAPGEPASGTRYVRAGDNYAIPLKVFDQQRRWIASIIVVVNADGIEARASALVEKAFNSVSPVLAVALIAYALVLVLVVEVRSGKDASPRNRLLWFSVLFAALAQVVAVALAGVAYTGAYTAATLEKSDILATLVRQDTESALARSIRLENLDFRHYSWQELARGFKELGALEIHDLSGELIVSVDARATRHFANDRYAAPVPAMSNAPNGFTEYHANSVYLVGDGQIHGRVIARISREALNQRLVDLAADGVATILVTLLVLVELLLILCRYLRRHVTTAAAHGTNYFSIMRPAVFFFLFGVDLSMSFIPLHMERLYEPMFGLSKDFVMGLPISVEFLFVGIAILAAGVWFDRSNWRQPFVAGVVLASTGLLYSWLAPDATHFIISRAVLGTGYGLTLLASQGFIITHSNSRNKVYGLAQLFAGLYGGSICGSVAGAMLAERLGFGAVFLIGGVIVFLVLLYVAAMLPSTAKSAPIQRVAPKRQLSATARTYRLLSNRSMLGLMLFSSLPASIAAVGFLYYFSPIYLNRLGASQSTIGQVLMLYGVCLVFLGPWLSRRINTAASKKLAIFAGCLLGGAAFLSFNALDGPLAVAVAVLVLGVSHSLVLSSQSAYVLDFKATRELGKGKAMGIFESSDRIGQMLGPIAFGCVIVATDIERAITYLGYAYVAMAFIFWLLTRNDRHMLTAA